MRPCETFPNEACLLPGVARPEWRCCVCRAVTDWLDRGYDRIYVREHVRGKSLVYVFPGRGCEPAPANCLLRMDGGTHSRNDIRETLNTLLDILDEVWLWEAEPAPHSRRLKP